MGIIKKMQGNQRLYNDTETTIAKIFDILSHPGRIKIICLLLVYESITVGEIKETLFLSQSATSELLKQLKNSGLLFGKEIGTSIHYSLNREMWQDIRDVLFYFLEEVK